MRLHPDQFAEARDQLFDERDGQCACCRKRTPDVGAFTDADGSNPVCTDCGLLCPAGEACRQSAVEVS